MSVMAEVTVNEESVTIMSLVHSIDVLGSLYVSKRTE